MIYEKGEKVEALDLNGIWYSAEVLEFTDQETFVKYKGWPAKWNRWVSKTQVRAITSELPRKRRTFYSRQVCTFSLVNTILAYISLIH